MDKRPLNLVDCSLDDAVRLTGLRADEAAMAQDRRYTIPMALEDDSDRADAIHAAAAADLQVITGGRFSHLQGKFNKGDAMDLITRTLDRLEQATHTTIALGDNQNDTAMLARADLAVVVKSQGKHAVNPEHKRTIYTEHPAPEGWREGISQALGILMETE